VERVRDWQKYASESFSFEGWTRWRVPFLGAHEGLEEFSFSSSFFPQAAFALGEAALVAFFAGLAVFFLGETAFLGFDEDFGGSVVEVGGLGDGGADAFFDQLYDFDRTFI
jgi:hypothetical protein